VQIGDGQHALFGKPDCPPGIQPNASRDFQLA
jgi:hypothetical protein